MDNNKNGTFSYSYSAKERAEIEKIRSKYTSEEKEQDKMKLLKRLDSSVTKKAMAVSLIIGIVGLLIMGAGMSLVMTEFSQIFGSYEWLAMPVGITAGMIGMAITALAYPIYVGVVKIQRKKVAPEIIRLSGELMGTNTTK